MYIMCFHVKRRKNMDILQFWKWANQASKEPSRAVKFYRSRCFWDGMSVKAARKTGWDDMQNVVKSC